MTQSILLELGGRSPSLDKPRDRLFIDLIYLPWVASRQSTFRSTGVPRDYLQQRSVPV
ncbi:MAG TPA: hypothetical protein V6D50_23340 [Chroococcales cyanobacterium]